MTSPKKKFSYEFARKALMVDAVVLGLKDSCLQTLLIRRGEKTYKNWWALPGGHVEIDETLEEAVHRELGEETSVHNVYLQQFHAFSAVKRDPREPTVSVAYYAVASPDRLKIKAMSDAKEVRWFPIDALPKLAFDHAEIIRMGLERMRRDLADKPLLASVLGPAFTIGQLHAVYEKFLGQEVDKSNFRRDYLKKGLLEETSQIDMTVTHRPPRLYRFRPPKILGSKSSGSLV